MSFLNPFFLLGLAAIAAPILVHLVRRTRARRVEFPTLYFVRQVPQRTIRRRTLHNLLLLILRCLAVLLVVFAFTRPFFSGVGAAQETVSSRASVILLDTSLSMREGVRFAEAARRAETIIGEAQGDERVAVMRFGESYEILRPFTEDKTAARAALTNLGAGYEGTDYEQALRGAEALFGESRTDGLKRVYLISDFQATGWKAANRAFKLRNDIRLVAIDVGNEATANVALTNVEARGAVYGQRYADKLAVHVSNFADEARESVTLDFQINEQSVEKRALTLAPRETKVVEFTNFNLAEGANRCVIALGAEDFAHDNQIYFTLRGEKQGKALIIDSAVRGRGESFYLRHALSTDDNLPFAFSVKSAGAVDPAGVQEQALVILNDAGALPSALAESIARFVESGGQLIIATGPRTRAESFNGPLQRIAPAALRDAVMLPRGESIAMTDVKMAHPVFEVFRGSGRLSSARVFGYTRTEPREGANVLARFEDGSPALVELSVGARGRVLLFTSTLGMSWNDLPLTPTYLPFVQQLARYLGERDVPAWHKLGETFTVEKEAAGGAIPAIDAPTGVRLKTGSLTPEGDLLLTGREPGFYRLRYAARPDFAAVNVSGDEGDFAKLNLEAFMAGVTGGEELSPAGAATDERLRGEEIEARQRIWWPLLVAALLLFAAESLIARRTKMVKMIG